MKRKNIKVDPFIVGKHADSISQKNSVLSFKGSDSSVSCGTTNFAGYKKGIEYRDELGTNVANLAKAIGEDCGNIRRAASELNRLDTGIAKKIEVSSASYRKK